MGSYWRLSKKSRGCSTSGMDTKLLYFLFPFPPLMPICLLQCSTGISQFTLFIQVPEIPRFFQAPSAPLPGIHTEVHAKLNQEQVWLVFPQFQHNHTKRKGLISTVRPWTNSESLITAEIFSFILVIFQVSVAIISVKKPQFMCSSILKHLIQTYFAYYNEFKS